jgi:hypothetical protein
MLLPEVIHSICSLTAAESPEYTDNRPPLGHDQAKLAVTNVRAPFKAAATAKRVQAGLERGAHDVRPGYPGRNHFVPELRSALPVYPAILDRKETGMGNRSALDLLGLTERTILTILWRDGPSSVQHLQPQLGSANYTTVTSPLQSLQCKGFVTKTGPRLDYRFHALPKEALLLLACERRPAELEATPAERARDAEALRHE